MGFSGTTPVTGWLGEMFLKCRDRKMSLWDAILFDYVVPGGSWSLDGPIEDPLKKHLTPKPALYGILYF